MADKEVTESRRQARKKNIC